MLNQKETRLIDGLVVVDDGHRERLVFSLDGSVLDRPKDGLLLTRAFRARDMQRTYESAGGGERGCLELARLILMAVAEAIESFLVDEPAPSAAVDEPDESAAEGF